RHSTVRGKKSTPSRAVEALTAATNNIVSPYRMTTDPSACLATRPDSTVNSFSPSLIDSLRYFFSGIFCSPSNFTPEHVQVAGVTKHLGAIAVCASNLAEFGPPT